MIFAYYSCLLEALKQPVIIETDGLLSTECVRLVSVSHLECRPRLLVFIFSNPDAIIIIQANQRLAARTNQRPVFRSRDLCWPIRGRVSPLCNHKRWSETIIQTQARAALHHRSLKWQGGVNFALLEIKENWKEGETGFSTTLHQHQNKILSIHNSTAQLQLSLCHFGCSSL